MVVFNYVCSIYGVFGQVVHLPFFQMATNHICSISFQLFLKVQCSYLVCSVCFSLYKTFSGTNKGHNSCLQKIPFSPNPKSHFPKVDEKTHVKIFQCFGWNWLNESIATCSDLYILSLFVLVFCGVFRMKVWFCVNKQTWVM